MKSGLSHIAILVMYGYITLHHGSDLALLTAHSLVIWKDIVCVCVGGDSEIEMECPGASEGNRLGRLTAINYFPDIHIHHETIFFFSEMYAVI